MLNSSHRASRFVVLASLLITAGFCGVHADVKLPAIFGDHMVLQEDAKLPIWGTANAGEKVTVTFGGETGSATAAADGTWRVDLPPVTSSDKGQILTVAGTNTLTFQDVLVGDVWIASGQSNMQFGIIGDMHAHDTIASLNDPSLRLFAVPNVTSLDPKTDIGPVPATSTTGHWQICTPDLLAKDRLGFSAVALYFAKDIRAKTGKPVGVIGTYVGGTPAQSWTSAEGLQADPVLAHYIADHQKAVDDYPKLAAAFPALNDEFKAKQKAWYDTDEGKAFKDAMSQWQKDSAAAVANGGPPAVRPAIPKSFPNHGPTPPDGGNHVPSTLWNGMVAPLVPFAIKGAIWYQGESNGDSLPPAVEYAHLFPDMIKDWRAHWNQGDFPFFFVLLANFRTPATTPSQDYWPWLREGQLKALDLPNTGTGSAIDVGDAKTIHPLDKLDVGHRLALAARAVAYGEKDLVYSGPTYDSMKVEGNKIRLTFKNRGGGLIMGTPPPSSGNPNPQPPTELKGFGIAGADQKFVWATATIDGDTVVVSSDQVAAPAAVRYDWADNPPGNLYNKANLPANPFRTDDWTPVAINPNAKPPTPAPTTPEIH